jgi:hypothetical protein
MLAIRKSSSANDPSWGFVPFDVFDAGSDLHRAYLTRLCCDFRLSQPLDVLIPPAPPRPCFMPNPSLRFCSQRLPPPSRRHGFHRALPLLPLATPKRDPTSGIFAPGRSVRVRSVLPVSCRSILSQLSSPRKGFPSSLGFASLQCLLSWAFHNVGIIQHCDRSTECQRTQG